LALNHAESQIARYEASLKPRRASAAAGRGRPEREAAVFVLFTETENGAAVLLIRRPRDTGRHRGEWAFPGGVREAEDASLLSTAYRETEEELGIPADAIERWGELDPVSTVGTGFLVWPFTGKVAADFALAPSAREVDEVAMMPVETFTAPHMRRSISLRRDGAQRELRAYASEGRVVWGATARILSQIFDDAPGQRAATA
jgi:8-oxo-dGTP pyrophosphatase MutT (NUDIX family)